jgi:hypothetical protein
MIDGVFRHQDSNGGGGGLITDGDTQWMTAGAGLSLALITLLTSTVSSAFLSFTLRSTLEIQLRRAVHQGCVRSRPGPARR